MKKHLRFRLMAIMLALVLITMIFAGLTLFMGLTVEYNQNFYTEMEDLQAQVHLWEEEHTPMSEIIARLQKMEEFNPLTSDRSLCVFRGNMPFSGVEGYPQYTDNLMRVLEGGISREAGLFSETLDYAWQLNDEKYVVYVADQRTDLTETMKKYIFLFGQALLISVVLAVALSFWLARRFLVPIQKLTVGAKAMYEEGEFKMIPATSQDEVGELARVFNKMGTHITKNIQMLNDLLQNIPKPWFAVNQQATIVHSNAAFKMLFEQPPLKSVFQGHKREKRFIACIEGRYYNVYRSPFLLEDGGEGTLYLLDDITEAENLENERKKFVANVSHELKTPLTIIKSYSETLQESDLDEPTRQRFLQTVERSADQMNTMVNQLLELSKTDSAPAGIKEPLDLVQAVHEVREAMEMEFQKKELTCITKMPAERILTCEADKVRRVMINLMSNSIKYSNPGGKVTVSIEETEGGVLFSVEDQGIGIEKKHIPYLFDKFYRVDKARSRETGGTGLGLSIVHSIVSGMGGRVEVESTFGKGSIFTCYFPD